jgi:hypothetical protein
MKKRNVNKTEINKFVKNRAKKGANLFERMFMHDEKEKEWP